MEKSLNICTLRPFMVKKENSPLLYEKDINKKPWLLFKYLITYRDKTIHPEVLAEMLWPDENYKNPKHTIRNLIYRLRKILDTQNYNLSLNSTYISSSPNGYSFNTQANYRLDVEIFEDLCQKAASLKQDEPDRALEAYSKAINIYENDYLPELPYCEWGITARNYYHWMFVDNVLHEINLLEEYDYYPEIISTCEHAFKIEPLEENIHLKYIKSLIKLNKLTHARSHYQYAVSFFQNELNINPFPPFQKINQESTDENISNKINIQGIKKDLKNKEITAGPFFCEPDIFRLLYKVEEKKERKNSTGILGSITINENSNFLSEKMKQLTDIIKFRLSSENIVTRWNYNQYLILFPDKKTEEVKHIFNLLLSELHNQYDLNLNDITCDYDLL